MIPITADFEKYLDNYIEVIIKKGLNIQPGQRLLIASAFDPGVPLELANFVRRIAEKAYKSGAKLVDSKKERLLKFLLRREKIF